MTSPLPGDARSFVATYITIVPVQSARDAWFEASCDYSGCSWSTTGWEPVCEEAAYEHAASHLAAPSPLPTDEDREALVNLIGIAPDGSWPPHHLTILDDEDAREYANRILAAGFRRSVVSTPSDEVRALIAEGEHHAAVFDGYENSDDNLIARLTAALSAVSAPPTITDSLKAAAVPQPGERYLWMPHAPHAREEVVVRLVEWNGHEFWVTSENVRGGGRARNSLDRWIEATVALPDDEDGR